MLLGVAQKPRLVCLLVKGVYLGALLSLDGVHSMCVKAKSEFGQQMADDQLEDAAIYAVYLQ